MLADSGVPHTVLRAAQFHDLVLKTARGMAKLPVVPRPGGLRAGRGSARRAGPRPCRCPPAAAMLPVRIPGKAGRAYRAGDNVVLDGAQVGKRTWADFLGDTVSR